MLADSSQLIQIDGAHGEGGGQILRTCLALSLRTGRPFQLSRVRHNREKPGLRPQHLVAVQSAAQLGAAVVEGAHVGSSELTFSPQLLTMSAGNYHFDIGTAGSAPLVLQTLLPALLAADGVSTLHITGGTYNPKAPPFDFVARSFVPALRLMGITLQVELLRPGFYPKGGGQLRATITPCARPSRLDLLTRGPVLQQRATVLSAKLPAHIATRELEVLRTALRWPASSFTVRELPDSYSPGNVVLIELQSEQLTEVFSCVGERGVPAEDVARSCLQEAQTYLAAEVPVGEHLADQLLLPMALGEGGQFLTTQPSLHTLTQIDMLQRFLPVHIAVTQKSAATFLIAVSPVA